MTRRIGLLGGTFDPPHLAHLVVADQVLDQVGLDEVRLVVSNRPWQKEGSRTITAAAERLALVEAAVDGLDRVTASAIELELGGASYTIATVEELQRREPDVAWSIVVGADAAAGLDTWHRADELRRRHEIVVVNRPGTDGGPPSGWRCRHVEIPGLALSSTELRAMVAAGRSIRHLTPERVVQLLTTGALYRQGS
ncbi:MAG: nicotinate-nucleotide adenylyltransferase [Acidimicrobiales bacterium]